MLGSYMCNVTNNYSIGVAYNVWNFFAGFVAVKRDRASCSDHLGTSIPGNNDMLVIVNKRNKARFQWVVTHSAKPRDMSLFFLKISSRHIVLITNVPYLLKCE